MNRHILRVGDTEYDLCHFARVLKLAYAFPEVFVFPGYFHRNSDLLPDGDLGKYEQCLPLLDRVDRKAFYDGFNVAALKYGSLMRAERACGMFETYMGFPKGALTADLEARLEDLWKEDGAGRIPGREKVWRSEVTFDPQSEVLGRVPGNCLLLIDVHNELLGYVTEDLKVFSANGDFVGEMGSDHSILGPDESKIGECLLSHRAGNIFRARFYGMRTGGELTLNNDKVIFIENETTPGNWTRQYVGYVQTRSVKGMWVSWSNTKEIKIFPCDILIALVLLGFIDRGLIGRVDEKERYGLPVMRDLVNEKGRRYLERKWSEERKVVEG